MVASSSPVLGTRQARACVSVIGVVAASALFLWAQSDASTSSSNAGLPAQTSLQNAVLGSVADNKPTPGGLPLTFRDAIERDLRHNLAALLSEYNTTAARGEKWKQLSDLLPNVNASVQEVFQKQSLEALGLRNGQFPRVIGPFSYFDVRASASQRLFDWKAIPTTVLDETGSVGRAAWSQRKFPHSVFIIL